MRFFRWLSVFILLSSLFLAASCQKEPASLDVFWVRGGLALVGDVLKGVEVSSGGEKLFSWQDPDQDKRVLKLGPDKCLVLLPLKPGREIEVSWRTSQGRGKAELVVPVKPSPFLVHTLDLEKVDFLNGRMGSNLDTVLKFSPGSDYLAIGSYEGYLRVVEVLSGRLLYKKKLAEGMVKRLAWASCRGKLLLYAGEQSPDGFLYCLEGLTGKEIWKYRTADDVGQGNRESDKRHAIYNLPGIYHLAATPKGDAVAVCTYGRYVADEYLHDCLVYRFDGQTGRVLWRWPENTCFPHGITWVGNSFNARTLALMSFSTLGPDRDHTGFFRGRLYCLDGKGGKVKWDYQVLPLAPYYNRVSTWQGVSVSPDGNYVTAGLNDGRVIFFEANGSRAGEPIWVRKPGAPVMVGDVPVASPVSYTAMTDKAVYCVTPGTTIPLSSGRSRGKAPAPHPGAGYLRAYGLAGELLWQYKTRGSSQGIFACPDHKLAAIAISQNRTDKDLNEFGFVLFDTGRKGGSNQKLIYHFATEGPCFFQADIAGNGLFAAVTEMPLSLDEGKKVHGSYRVHIIH